MPTQQLILRRTLQMKKWLILQVILLGAIFKLQETTLFMIAKLLRYLLRYLLTLLTWAVRLC